jgi:hypothetical protein
MPSAGFEPTISAIGRPQTHALEHTGIGIGKKIIMMIMIKQKYRTSKDLSNISGKYEIRELKNQPYWAVHTHFGNY